MLGNRRMFRQKRFLLPPSPSMLVRFPGGRCPACLRGLFELPPAAALGEGTYAINACGQNLRLLIIAVL